MRKNTLLFALTLLLGCSGLKYGLKSSHDQKEKKLKLSDDIVPINYNLTLWTTDKDNFSGQVAIDIELKKDTNSVFIHAQDLKILSSELIEENLVFDGQFVQVDDEGLARIDFAHKAPKGRYQLKINYSAKYRDDLSGLYQVKEGKDTYLFTQFEPLDARKMLPCFDEPRWKTPFEVRVISPKGQEVIANSALKSSYSQGDQQVHIFEPTKPISTYLLALAVGPFDIVESVIDESQYRMEKIKLRGVATKGKGGKLKYALKETPEILKALEDYFGIAYPFGKLDVIAVPDFSAGAMENVGAITFREWYLLLDQQSPIDQVKGFYVVMAHELAHQWFGNSVTMPWWDDLWLNESFATWVSHKIVDKLKPDFRSLEQLLGASQMAMEQDSLKAARKIREPINSNHDIHNAFDGITYSKGGAVLSMLENYLSPKLFRDAVFNHLTKFSYSSATSKDFLQSLANLSDPSLVKSAESFLNQNGFPLVTMSYRCGPKGFTIKAEQQKYIPAGQEVEDDRLWRIPLCLGYGSANGVTKHCTTMSKKNLQQEIRTEQCPDFIIPNFNGQGYYRFSLDILDWQNLIKDAKNLKEGDKMAIADSLIGELYSGKLDFEFVLEGLRQLIDINSSAVSGYFMHIFKEANHFWINSDNKSRFLSYARDAIQPIYEQLKNKSELTPDQRILRRDSAIFLATIVRDKSVRAELLPKGKSYLDKLLKGQKPKNDALMEDMLSECLFVAVQENPEYLNKVSNKLKTITDTPLRRHILMALAKSQEGESASEIRSLVFGDLRKNEQMRLFYDHLNNPKNQPATFSFFKDNYEKLKGILSNDQMGNTPFLAEGLCSNEDAKEVEKFFSPFITHFQGGPRNLLEVVEKINLCAARKQRHAQVDEQVVSIEN